uniref:Putative secreted protein n=1 Tax=Ixodes ricinus TaxID=34613 RepID=A0A6B0UDS5_IXORI
MYFFCVSVITCLLSLCRLEICQTFRCAFWSCSPNTDPGDFILATRLSACEPYTEIDICILHVRVDSWAGDQTVNLLTVCFSCGRKKYKLPVLI